MQKLRIASLIALTILLVYLCLQTDHARLKDYPMESWRLAPLLLLASVAALIGRKFLNPLGGLFLGGIGGALGTLDSMATVYGGVVGLVVGAILVLLPVIPKWKPGNFPADDD